MPQNAPAGFEPIVLIKSYSTYYNLLTPWYSVADAHSCGGPYRGDGNCNNGRDLQHLPGRLRRVPAGVQRHRRTMGGLPRQRLRRVPGEGGRLSVLLPEPSELEGQRDVRGLFYTCNSACVPEHTTVR
jgi:hypothetical protein